MDIVLGAGGQVGSQLAALLETMGRPVRRVFHHKPWQVPATAQGSEAIEADYLDASSLKRAFSGGGTVLLLAPESMTSEDMQADAERVFANYRAALESSGIRRVVGLSSGGAQLSPQAGTLRLYAMLEESLFALDAEVYIVRPSYYYSNWMMYWQFMRDEGILPTFFPIGHRLPMIAPDDVAAFLAQVMANGMANRTAEITGPEDYTPADIARMAGEALGRGVTAVQTPREQWLPGLLQAGFSQSSAEHLLGMTQAVIDGKTGFTLPSVYTQTTFPQWLRGRL